MVVFYILGGINHFVHPGFYLKIMPAWLPYHLLLLDISGVCEALFALLLLPVATRRLGAWLIILLLIAIFPANIQMAVSFMKEHSPYLWIAIVRLPLQLVLIWWAWIFTKVKVESKTKKRVMLPGKY